MESKNLSYEILLSDVYFVSLAPGILYDATVHAVSKYFSYVCKQYEIIDCIVKRAYPVCLILKFVGWKIILLLLLQNTVTFKNILKILCLKQHK